MDLQEILDSFVTNQVALSSAATYEAVKLRDLSLQITVNLSSNRTRFVGGSENPIYPEIIVWKPNAPGSGRGKAVVVESVETPRTIEKNVFKWKRLASLGVIFNLLIPEGQEAKVKGLLQSNDIKNTKLQVYKLNNVTKRYDFTNVT